ncbi:uncharacterized protein Tco025E_01119 [Trypanosoma conorhini]|uniref:Uncharacterized protein n=1 Tax=Trypanosoma conorhini TaxID=83891 RepID=A0A3S5IUL8_9TRYP|nr:uncharacterized protein Tco025E_01119 [Trypanosoma conorhini]RNF26657.1 hypothetical protein Tco025E_01119 [Trypanosoma conorhini]
MRFPSPPLSSFFCITSSCGGRLARSVWPASACVCACVGGGKKQEKKKKPRGAKGKRGGAAEEGGLRNGAARRGPPPPVPLRPVELSEAFVKLLGVDRRSAESLQPLLAARCRQLLPAPQGTHGSPSRGVRETLATRVAPRAVLLTSSGSLFVLKHRGGGGAVVMESPEFGAHLQRHGSRPWRRAARPSLQHRPRHAAAMRRRTTNSTPLQAFVRRGASPRRG